MKRVLHACALFRNHLSRMLQLARVQEVRQRSRRFVRSRGLKPAARASVSIAPLIQRGIGWMIFVATCLVAVEVFAGGGFDRAIAAVRPRVVKLYGLSVGREKGYGSGVLVSADGLVLTVSSILLDGQNVRAVLFDGSLYAAKLVRRDETRQLALLQLGPAAEEGAEPAAVDDAEVGPFPFFDIACRRPGDALPAADGAVDCDALLQPADWVLAAGNPFKVAEGAEPVSISHGVFSTRTRLDAKRRVREFPYHGDVLVIDAVTSNPGSPGSALVNLDGAFVGMIGRVVKSNRTHTHFNYAMPRDVLYEFLLEAKTPEVTGDDALLVRSSDSGGEVERFDTGIRITRTAYVRIPPLVDRVRRGSLAAGAGVRRDDLILSINGETVADVEAYDKRMSRLSNHESIVLVIRRGRRILSVRIEPQMSEEAVKP